MINKRAWMALAGAVVASGVALAQPHAGGPGMMGGHGMGPGMMWGYGSEGLAGLMLSAEQQKKIAAVRQESFKAMWPLMGKMHEQGYPMHGMFGLGAFDEAAARKAFQDVQEAQKAMFDLQLEAR